MKNQLIALIAVPIISIATMGTASAWGGYNCGYTQPHNHYTHCCKRPTPKPNCYKPRCGNGHHGDIHFIW